VPHISTQFCVCGAYTAQRMVALTLRLTKCRETLSCWDWGRTLLITTSSLFSSTEPTSACMVATADLQSTSKPNGSRSSWVWIAKRG
jgi:hypothetical protein